MSQTPLRVTSRVTILPVWPCSGTLWVPEPRPPAQRQGDRRGTENRVSWKVLRIAGWVSRFTMRDGLVAGCSVVSRRLKCDSPAVSPGRRGRPRRVISQLPNVGPEPWRAYPPARRSAVDRCGGGLGSGVLGAAILPSRYAPRHRRHHAPQTFRTAKDPAAKSARLLLVASRAGRIGSYGLTA